MIFRGRTFHGEERAVQMLWECVWHVLRTAWRSVWLEQSKGRIEGNEVRGVRGEQTMYGFAGHWEGFGLL